MNRIKRLSLFSLFALLSVFFIGINTIKAADVLSIENVEITDKSSGTEAIVSIDSGEITNSVTFHSLNEYVTYKITVKNNSGKKIVIKTITDDNSDNQIEYQYDKHETEEIDSNGELDLAVKAVYKNENTDMTNRSLNSKVTLVISYYDEGELKSSSITINPKTNDNIHLFISLLIVSFIGLTICSLIKSNSKIKKYLVIIGIIVTVPIMAKAASIACSIVFNAGITFEDKVLLTYVIDGQENTIVVPYDSLIEDIEFPCEEGYAPDDWKNEDNSDYDTSKRIKDDIKLYATLKYVAKPTITVTNFDSFSYTAPNAAAYYVSTSNTVPISSTEMYANFVLDKWTTCSSSDNISDLDDKYYVFAIDSNGNVSSNYQEIVTWDVTFNDEDGANVYVLEDGIACPQMGFIDYNGHSHIGYVCGTVKILDGASILIKASIDDGFNNMKIFMNNEEITPNSRYKITENTEFRSTASANTYILSLNPNGGAYDGETTLVMTLYTADNNSTGIPTKNGYRFLGWYTEPDGGNIVYSSDGRHSSNSTYWSNNISCAFGTCKHWVYKNNLDLYAHWAYSEMPVITYTSTNSFSYSSNLGIAYYVSSSSSKPSFGPVQDEFELDKWTTATSTTKLSLSNGSKFYVWTVDSDGNVSDSSSTELSAITLSFNSGNTFELRDGDINGDLIPITSKRAYVFTNTDIYIDVELNEPNAHYENLNKDYSITTPLENGGILITPHFETINNKSVQRIYSNTTFSGGIILYDYGF